MNPPTHVLSASLPPDCRNLAALLNRGCVCNSVDHERLRLALRAEGSGAPRAQLLNLFSGTSVYVAEAHLDFMAELIAVIERVVALPARHDRVFAHAPPIARFVPKAKCAFLGYDFHLGADGPRLIEINTNAGGGLLGAKLMRAQRVCCTPMPTMPAEALEDQFVAMFREEWRLTRGAVPLERIAIVDEAPASQFLAAEFELFRQLFESKGMVAVIADPRELSFDGKTLVCNGIAIDLVYNRMTDFSLEDTVNRPLRDAYLADAIVLTPHPHAHALYADKRNLIALSDAQWLAAAGVSAADRRILEAGVPTTRAVTPANATEFWSSRKQWFFKPATGFGSKAAYRGEKLTKRVFEAISLGGHVAQALVPPSERRLLIDGVERDLKLDLRNFVYRGEVQMASARLYQGQTTNFRTPGGGFAAVFSVPCGKVE
ncbi:MAG: hypothetical protein ABI478_10350 [Propionivibrio sp.]